MSRGARPVGARAMTNAQRQAAHRARHAVAVTPLPAVANKPERKARPLPMAEQWRDAVAVLVELQERYQDWLDRMPPGGSEATREALEAIVGLDLSDLDVEPPQVVKRD